MNNRDIFDKLIELPGFCVFQPFCKRFKEQLLYLFFGGLTFFLGIFLFWLFTQPFAMNALSANVIVWIICVTFAYLTNRTWVFKGKAHGVKGVIKECSSFMTGRLGTLGMEELVLWVGIYILGINSLFMKIVSQVLVIIGNYLISKFFVFKNERGIDEKQ